MSNLSGLVVVNGVLIEYRGRKRTVVIPEELTKIRADAFDGCKNLKEIVVEDISVIPAEYKKLAILGFANGDGRGSEKRIESHKKYIKTNAAKLVDLAMENIKLLSLMCREKLITPKNLELFVQKANESGNAEAVAMMLDYQETKVTAKQKEALKKKQEAKEEEVFERALARSGKEGIEGLRFATTGKLETFANRDELKTVIGEKGGFFATTISSKVDYLITNDTDTGSEKNKKAREMGIEIITEREFNEKVNRIFRIDEKGVLVKYMGAGEVVMIPEGVTEIGAEAFLWCKNLESITIPEGVTEIGRWAFFRCENLKSIAIPDGVTEIGESAFFGCESLESITIPDSVTEIGERAFSKCEVLADEKGFVIIRNVLYDYFGDATEVVIPESVTKIERWAFFGCKSLTSITIPKSVEKIGAEAFSYCERLVIHAAEGSCAEKYAKRNKIPFVAE